MDHFPKLSGDGVHDDTAAIQMRLDAGTACVYLPPPLNCYLISRPLRLNSNQELRLDRFTLIRLAPQSNCPMLINDDPDQGNRNIAVTGGIWDYNNCEQAPNYQMRGRTRPYRPGDRLPEDSLYDCQYSPDFYRGVGFLLVNIEHFVMTGVTLRNPVTYGAQFARLRHFTISDITFDYHRWNPSPNNMDGLHFDGGCRFGKIINLQGCCYDDLVALNANDGKVDSPCQGPISDIEIDGIFAENCHSAVRMLSCGAPVERIAVRNVHGSFYRYTVGLTHWADTPQYGRFDDIVLENFFIGKAHPHPVDFNTALCPEYPPVWIERRERVGRLDIRNLRRDEQTVATPTILIEPQTSVETLTIRDAECRNHLKEPYAFLENQGEIDCLVLDNVRLAGPHKSCVTGDGTIRELRQSLLRQEVQPV